MEEAIHYWLRADNYNQPIERFHYWSIKGWYFGTIGLSILPSDSTSFRGGVLPFQTRLKSVGMTFFGEIALSQNSITNCHYSVMFSPRAERNWKMLNWKIVLMKSLSNEYQANMLGELTWFSNTLHSGACMQTCKIVIVRLILVVNHHFQEIPGSSFHFAITLKWITKW